MGFGNAIEGERSARTTSVGDIEDNVMHTKGPHSQSGTPWTARHASFTKPFILSSYTSINNPCIDQPKIQATLSSSNNATTPLPNAQTPNLLTHPRNLVIAMRNHYCIIYCNAPTYTRSFQDSRTLSEIFRKRQICDY